MQRRLFLTQFWCYSLIQRCGKKKLQTLVSYYCLSLTSGAAICSYKKLPYLHVSPRPYIVKFVNSRRVVQKKPTARMSFLFKEEYRNRITRGPIRSLIHSQHRSWSPPSSMMPELTPVKRARSIVGEGKIRLTRIR